MFKVFTAKAGPGPTKRLPIINLGNKGFDPVSAELLGVQRVMVPVNSTALVGAGVQKNELYFQKFSVQLPAGTDFCQVYLDAEHGSFAYSPGSPDDLADPNFEQGEVNVQVNTAVSRFDYDPETADVEPKGTFYLWGTYDDTGYAGRPFVVRTWVRVLFFKNT